MRGNVILWATHGHDDWKNTPLALARTIRNINPEIIALLERAEQEQMIDSSVDQKIKIEVIDEKENH